MWWWWCVCVCPCVFWYAVGKLACTFHSCTAHFSSQALVTDALTRSRWLKVATTQSCIFHGSGASLSDLMGGHARKPSKDRGRTDMVQRQLRQEMTDVMEQLRTEMNETGNGRTNMFSSINTERVSKASKPIPNQRPHSKILGK